MLIKNQYKLRRNSAFTRAKFLAKRRKIADKLTKFVLKIYPDYSFVKSANLAFQSDFKHENLMIFSSAIL